MSKLTKISGAECVKVLAKVGFYLKRQEGSHMILRRDNPFAQVVVPGHKELRDDTLSYLFLFLLKFNVFVEGFQG